jgi:hypothetical protein
MFAALLELGQLLQHGDSTFTNATKFTDMLKDEDRVNYFLHFLTPVGGLKSVSILFLLSVRMKSISRQFYLLWQISREKWKKLSFWISVVELDS